MFILLNKISKVILILTIALIFGITLGLKLLDITNNKKLEAENTDIQKLYPNDFPDELYNRLPNKKVYLNIDEALKTPNDVYILNLRGKKLTSIPQSISNFKNLAIFIASNNNINQLPVELGEISSLRMVDLSVNKIKQIDPIVSLSNLRFLYLTDNEISALPEDIGKMEKLLILRLNRNKLNKLPQSIGLMASLTSLNVNYNNLTEIPSEVGTMSNLHSLVISNNSISELPSEITNLTKLKLIAVNKTKLSQDQLDQLQSSMPDLEIVTE
ncbi:hypothetical protein HY029_04090 [Candidatus Gottesmanbacteria bacterium]|nr:hypothetical protein [Candidatus Gottesmanbacteria bacterium]